ncbi:MAG: DUF5711 family protein [Bacteroidales bacterium]|jgi:hypothetical protein|nr:DUF5711 family protein [Bacteroidales bacterium]
MKKGLQIILNLIIFLLIAGFVWYMISSAGKEESSTVNVGTGTNEPFTSPYERIASFDLPEDVSRFEFHNDQLFISAGQSVYIYDTSGKQVGRFPVKPEVRDITVTGDNIYLLYPTEIEVYSYEGEKTHGWEACSDLSDYCSFTLAGDYIFVTDAANKNICKYTNEGNFVKFISSPVGFIIPSYSFDIETRNDTVFCVNSGRHLIETYTLDGKFISAFGGPGGEAGFFAGCCNPSYISFTSDGELITSEKGNPRISSYESNGKFKEVLLNSRLLGGGSEAYKVQTAGNRLFIAGKNKIVVYEKS